jgi:hypothetical protein
MGGYGNGRPCTFAVSRESSCAMRAMIERILSMMGLQVHPAVEGLDARKA